MRQLLPALLGMLLLTGCPKDSNVECRDNASCNLSAGGECVTASTGNQWCAYPDGTCPSGFRYSDVDIGDGLSGVCVAVEVDAGTDAPDAPVDTIAPTVVSHTPTAAATNVPTGVAVVVTFSEDILPSSVTPTTFRVLAGAVPVDGNLAVVGSMVSFVPSARLSPSIGYTATVTTSVTDLAGNALQSETQWTFQTGAGGWTPSQLLESDLNNNAGGLEVHFNRAGQGIAAWSLDRGYAALYANGTWSQGAPISTATFGGPAAVVMDSQGRATALNVNSTSLYAVRHSGGAWGTPVTIDTDAGGINGVAAGASDAGNVVAVWQQTSAAAPNIWASRYVEASGWSTAVLIETSTAATSDPSVAVLADGSAFAAWVQSNMLQVARMNTNGVWDAPTPLGAADTRRPAIAAGPGGTAILIWSNAGALQASRFSGAWSQVESINGATGSPQAALAIAIGTTGKAIALWLSGPTGFQNQMHAVYTPGTGWGGPLAIDVLAGGVNDPTVAFGQAEQAIAGWTQPQGAAGNISSGWGAVFSAASGWTEPQIFENDESAIVIEASIYYDQGTNTFGAVWIQSNNNRPSVYHSELQ